MANTVSNTTDKELLRSIIDGSITEFVDDSITGGIWEYAFYNCNNLTKVVVPNAVAIGNSAFAGCSSLEELDVSGVTSLVDNQTSIVGSGQCSSFLTGCSALKTLNFKSLTAVTGGNRGWGSGSGVETLVLPSIISFPGGPIESFTLLKVLDIGANITDFGYAAGWSSYSLQSTVLEDVVIRASAVPSLLGTVFLSGRLATDATKGQSGKLSNYKIYVPQNLISSYQSATNWSAYSTFFTAIEGSEYEHYYADGTPVE